MGNDIQKQELTPNEIKIKEIQKIDKEMSKRLGKGTIYNSNIFFKKSKGDNKR